LVRPTAGPLGELRVGMAAGTHDGSATPPRGVHEARDEPNADVGPSTTHDTHLTSKLQQRMPP